LAGFSVYSNLGQASGLLFFATGWGKESGVDLGRVIFSGTTDRSGAFLSSALGASLASALSANSMAKITANFMMSS
jgi:hypothetical protein